MAKTAYAVNPTAELKTALGAAQTAFNRAERQAGKYNITVAGAAKAHATASAAIEKTTTALARQEKLQANAATRRELHGQMLGTVATFTAVAAPVKLAIDYESAMADVKKVTNFDAPGFKQFSDDMLKLSTRIPMSAEGLAKIAAAAGQAGIAESELLRFTEDAAKMAVAFDISAEEAGSAMTGLRTNFKLNQDGVIALGDSYNHLANNMDATAGDLVNFANRVGGTASIYGFSGQQVGALGAAFVAMKTPAEVGSRAANALMMKLGNAGTAGKDAQAAFRRLGFSGKEMSEAFKKDAQGAMLKFLEAVKRSSDPMRELNAIIGEGFADDTAKLVSGLDEYKKALGLIGDEAAYAGSMEAEYAARSETTANSLELLKNAAARLGIILGSAVLPGITAVAGAVVAFLEPVSWLAAAFPGVTTAVFGLIAGFATLKLVALGGRYAATLVSDGWTIATGVFKFFTSTVLKANIALARQKVVAFASAAASKAQAVAQGVANTAMAVARSRYVASTAAAVRHGVVSTALAAKTGIVTVAQWALNAAMLANPITWIVVGIMAVVAAFVLLYNKSETVRNFIQGAWQAVAGFFTGLWDGIGAVVSTVWSGVSAFITAPITAVKTAWGGITGFFGGLWDGIVAAAKAPFDWIAGKFEWITNAWGKVTGFFSGIFGGDEEEGVPTGAAAKPMTAVVPDATTYDEWGYTPPPSAPASGGAAAQPASVPKPVASAPNISGGLSIQPQISFSVSFSGVPSKDVGEALVGAIRSKESELVSYFEKMMERIASTQRRLAYDQ
jgi:TP901 family phage tail tape measure protein